jgi:death-on-curing protein
VTPHQLLSGDDLHRIADRMGLVVRDAGLLAAAAARPAATVFGADAYAGLHAKAAAVMESIIRSHPLVDGNKRLAWVALVVTHDINGVHIDVDDDEAFALTMAVAAGEAGLDDITAALDRWSPGSA